MNKQEDRLIVFRDELRRLLIESSKIQRLIPFERDNESLRKYEALSEFDSALIKCLYTLLPK